MSKKNKKSKKYGSKLFIERPQRFDAIQFHGDEDFDDEVLSAWLDKYQIDARIVTAFNPADKDKDSAHATILEIQPRLYYSDEPLEVWEGCWIVMKHARARPEIIHDSQFHLKYMGATDTNS